MKKEYLIAILIGILVIFLVNLPFIFGYFANKGELVYLGRRGINSQDLYTYVSFIEQGKQGRVLLENLYMSEGQTPSLFRPSYLVIGKIANLFNLSSIAAYHLFRLIFTCLFFIILYQFIKIYFDSSFKRLLAFSLTLISSGLGFAVGVFLPDLSDLWIPESITFLSLGEAPHFILSLILMLSGFIFFLKGVKEKKSIFYILSSILFLSLSFEHPFNLFVVATTLGVTSLWLLKTKKYPFKDIFLGLGIVLPVLTFGIFYQIVETSQNPVLRAWAAQNSLLSPSPVNYILGYGLILVFATIGAEKFLRTQNSNNILLLSWIAASFVLVYSPIFFQRRFIEGVHIPLSLVATAGIIVLLNYFSKYIHSLAQSIFSYIFVFIVIFFLGISSFVTSIKEVLIITSDNLSSYYYYLLKDEFLGMNWAKENTTSKDVFLTSWFYGNLLPGITGRKVFLGHKVQTPYFDNKVAQANKFFEEKDILQALQFLRENKITYIFLGSNDSIYQTGFKPEEKPFLEKVFEKNGVFVFKVKS